MNKLAAKLDEIAAMLEINGHVEEAFAIDKISDFIEKNGSDFGPKGEKFTRKEQFETLNTAVQLFPKATDPEYKEKLDQLKLSFEVHFGKAAGPLFYEVAKKAAEENDTRKYQGKWDLLLLKKQTGQIQAQPPAKKEEDIFTTPIKEKAPTHPTDQAFLKSATSKIIKISKDLYNKKLFKEAVELVRILEELKGS